MITTKVGEISSLKIDQKYLAAAKLPAVSSDCLRMRKGNLTRNIKLTIVSILLVSAFSFGYLMRGNPMVSTDVYEDLPASTSFVVKNNGSDNFWAVRNDGMIEYESPNSTYVIQSAIDATTSKGGTIFVMSGSYNASVTVKDKVLMILEAGVSGIIYTVNNGGYCIRYSGGYAWFDIPLNLNGHEIRFAAFHTGDIAPSHPVLGQWWYDTATYSLKIYNGTAWAITQGPKGDTGERGAKGEKGDQGAKGEKGDQGGTPILPYSYVIFTNSSGNYYAENQTGHITCNGSSLKTVLQNAHNTLNSGGTIYIEKLAYIENLSLPILTITNNYIRITGDYPNLKVGDNVMTANNHEIIHVKANHTEIDHLVFDGNGGHQSYAPSWFSEEALLEIWQYRWNTASLKNATILEDIKVHDNIFRDGYTVDISAHKVNQLKIFNNQLLPIAGWTGNRKNIFVTWSNDSEVVSNFMDVSTDFVGNSNNIHLYRGGDWMDLNSGCRRFMIKDNTAIHSLDCPIEATGALAQSNTWHEQIVIEGNVVWGRTILFSQAVKDSMISNNIIMMDGDGNTGNSAIGIIDSVGSSSANTIQNIGIFNNHIWRTGGSGSKSAIQLRTYQCKISDIIIEGNNIHDTLRAGISIDFNNVTSPNHSTRIKISNNKIHGCGYSGILIANSVAESEWDISANEIYNNGQYGVGFGINIQGEGRFYIANNAFFDDESSLKQSVGINLASEAIYGRVIGNRFSNGTGLNIGTGNSYWFIDGNDFYGCSIDVVDNNDIHSTVYGGNRNQTGSYVNASEP